MRHRKPMLEQKTEQMLFGKTESRITSNTEAPSPGCEPAAGGAKAPSKTRSWGFRISNWTEEHVKKLEAEPTVYKCWQMEETINSDGEKNPHMHVFLYYANPRAFGPLKKKYPTAHFERYVRNMDKYIDYCMKEDTRVLGPFEYGERPEQGRRKDLEEIGKQIAEGEDLKEIAMENPGQYIRYFKGMQALKQIINSKDRELGTLKTYWFHGASETGKSRTAHEFNPKSTFRKPNNKWWDLYEGEEVVVIDDYDNHARNGIEYRELLVMLDKWYTYAGEVKGGTVRICAKIIVITCEHPPEQFWSDNELKQVTRRLTEIREFK